MKKVAFSTGAFYTIETADALRRIRKAGFPNAELMPQCSEDLSPVMLKKADEIGIHISSIHYPLVFFGILYNANPGMYRESKKFSDNLAEFAKAAGTEFVVIHPEEEYTGKFVQLLGKPINDSIRYMCAALADKGITVAMENYPTGVGQHPDTLDAYVKSLAIPNMKVMVDTTEVIEGGGDPLPPSPQRLRREEAHPHRNRKGRLEGSDHPPEEPRLQRLLDAGTQLQILPR